MKNLFDIRTGVETITPEIAREYLKANTSNRPMSNGHVETISNQMKKGEFLLNGESIIFSNEGVLMQGQHRLAACVKSNTPFQSVVVRGIPYSSFHTLDSGRNRSTSDIFAIQGVPDYAKMSTIVSSYMKIHNGISSYAGREDLRRLKISKKEVYDEYNKQSQLFTDIKLFACRCYDKMRILKHADIGGIMAYLIIDKKHPQDFVESFFTMLFYQTNVSNDTINVLRVKLINDLASDRKMTPKYKLAIIAKCWNAYVENKEMKVLSYNEGKEGIVNFK